jgi:hypothetical protein
MNDLSVHVSDDPEDFLKIALQASKILGGELGQCFHGLDQSYWDICANGRTITVHREHYCGISIFSADEPTSIGLLKQYAYATGCFDPAWPQPPSS